MISINLSLDQLVEAVRNLNEVEKQQIIAVLSNKTPELTEEQQQEILYRETEYKSGRMKTYTLDEVKASFDFRD